MREEGGERGEEGGGSVCYRFGMGVTAQPSSASEVIVVWFEDRRHEKGAPKVVRDESELTSWKLAEKMKRVERGLG